jgi:deoxyribonuclease-4
MVFGHTGYLINIASPPGPNRDRSIQSLIREIEIATQLDLPFLVLHPGAHMGAGIPAGIQQAIDGLNAVISATKKSKVRIALENTAGQGTCLGHDLDHLSSIFSGLKKPERFGICLDTAHLFEAGFDIRSRKIWDTVLSEVDQRLGLDRVLAMHLNDSKTPLGSRVDRHAGIGLGHIGEKAFRHVINEPRFKTLPGCLETPKSADQHEDVENLAILRSLQKKDTRRQSAKVHK